MDSYVYKAFDSTGAVQEGEIPAVSFESARFKLKEKGFTPVSIKKKEKDAFSYLSSFRFERNIGLADIEFVTSKISILLKNGVKADRAFELARNGISNSAFKKILEGIYEDIRKGIPLSEAIAKYPHIFDSLYVSIVKIGEATGKLSDVFSDIASGLSFKREVASKTRQAMAYPAVILFVCLASVFFIFNFIVPRFSVVFSGVRELPVYTEMLLSVSLFFQKYQWGLLTGSMALVFLFFRVKEKMWFKRSIDLLLIRIPVVNNLCITLENLRFTSALATLLRNGVVLSDALDYAVNAISNNVLKKRMVFLKNDVRQGVPLSEAMAKTGFFPDVFDGLVEVGEQTGNLAEIFQEMEVRLKSLYENRVSALITLVEPLMIIFMGLIVGAIVVVMLLSMVSINDITF